VTIYVTRPGPNQLAVPSRFTALIRYRWETRPSIALLKVAPRRKIARSVAHFLPRLRTRLTSAQLAASPLAVGVWETTRPFLTCFDRAVRTEPSRQFPAARRVRASASVFPRSADTEQVPGR
jgi:hypothetical protein